MSVKLFLRMALGLVGTPDERGAVAGSIIRLRPFQGSLAACFMVAATITLVASCVLHAREATRVIVAGCGGLAAPGGVSPLFQVPHQLGGAVREAGA